MNKILYRNITKSDYPRLKQLIEEAFDFNQFIYDKKLLDQILTIYLNNCLISSSFGKVAVKNNIVIGLILGDAENDKYHLRKPHNLFNLIKAGFPLIFASKENKILIKEFSKITRCYNELIKDQKNDFQGCIQLFIVSKESRGLGIGKTLIQLLLQYMNRMSVTSLYLYTDTRCNYGFYDNQNFKRISTKTLYLDSVKETLGVFLYAYQL